MHHTQEGKRKCIVRSACAGSSAALLALSGGVGIPAPAASVIVRPATDIAIALRSSSTISRAARPESPPPRA
jgi:hypothetical protein